MKRKKISAAALAVLLTVSLAMQTAAAQSGYHQPYLFGYPDGTIRPEAAVTREELAQMLYRLLEEEPEPSQTPSRFCDVSEDRWSYPAISVLAGMGVMPGDTYGKYHPQKTVSGIALTVVLDQISYTGAEEHFPVLAERWDAQRESMADKLMQKETVQRAETAALLNRLLDRSAETEGQMGSALFSDNADSTKWFYADIREAAIPHSWERKDREVWTAVS